jgi:DNA invertase Pin-like site-specific DNA recombinase
MNTNGVRAAIYLRVSRDDQTTENQRLALARVAEHRGWTIVQTYEDQGISGAKSRDQRPGFNQMLKDAVRRRFDILMVWSIDRLGRSVLHVANALAELDAAGVRLYCDQQGIDSSTPMGRAMIQMASVFGEQERSMLRSRVLAGLDRVRQQGKKLGRPKVSPKVENAIRDASERREGHPEGGRAGRRREWHRSTGQEGDGVEAGGSRMSQTVQRPVDAAFWGWLGCGHSSPVAP